MSNHRSPLAFPSACLLIGLAWVLVQPQSSQTEKGAGCRDEIAASDGYKFRSVRVKVRYLPKLRTPLPPPGAEYSPATVTETIENVHQALKDEANRENEEGETEHQLLRAVTLGKGNVEDRSSSGIVIGIGFVTSCTKVVEPRDCEHALGKSNSKCVDVAIHAISLRVDTGNPLANLLNIPRSNRPTFLSNVPGPLLAFNPKLGLTYDRKLGTTGTFEMATNLLDLGRNLKSQSLRARRTRLDLQSRASKSMAGSYYATATKLSFSRSFPNGVDYLALDASFTADHQPLGENQFLKSAATIGGGMRLRTSFGPLEDIALHAGYRWSSNRFTGRGLASEFTAENAFEGNALFDGRLVKGISRLAIWMDGASPVNKAHSYRRVAALWGYQKELVVIPNQAFGIETLLGAGRAWGAVPQYARFYGGNFARNFLYEAKDSPVVTTFPTGPLLRSFGSGQATTKRETTRPGGTSYWNLNLNVSIPVRKWSSPLVPNITIDLPRKDQNGRVVIDRNGDPVMEDRPLREILKSQGETSRKVLERIFKNEGMSQQDAAAKARRELRSINSILGFVADQANIYSVKPLFMFDAARLTAPDSQDSKARIALGAGLQFTVVIAKFEAGYMRTVRALPGDNKGNFVMRLFFQNLF